MDSYSVEAVLSLKEIGYMKKMAEAIEQAEGLEKQAESTGKSMTRSFTAASVASSALTKAFGAITKSIGSAVNRFDAISNFPRVMDTLGFKADVAQEKIGYLADVTDALPTTLNEIVQSTQTLTATLGDLEKGTDTAVALNDMFIAGGQGADAASRAMTQYNQILAKGKVDMQSWNTLVEVAPGQMKQLAQSLLGASAGQKDLYEALQQGTISIDEMNDAVIRMDKEAGDGFSSFHDQALGATKGIGTAWLNLQNAVVKGTADIIDQMNEAAQAAGMPGLAESIDIARGYMTGFFDMMAKGAGTMVSFVAPAVTAVADNFGLIAKVSGEVVAGIEAMKIIKKLSSWLDSTKSSIAKAKTALDKYQDAMNKYGDSVNATIQAESKRKQAIKAAEEAEKASQRAMKSRVAMEKAATASAEASAAAKKEDAKNSELSAIADEKATIAKEARAKWEKDCAIATEAQATASAAATAATEAETAADTLSNGQITIKTALLGLLSKEYTLAEAGQIAWNVAMAANPIGLIITGATALISAITILNDKFGGLSEEEKAAAEAEQEFHDACSDSVGTVKKTADELERSSSAAKEHSGKIDDLVSRYKKLSKQESLSADEKNELAGIVQQLNDNIDGLNLAYDRESGRLSKTADEVEKKANAYNKMKEAEAVQEGINSLIEQENDLTQKQLEAREKLSEAQDNLKAKTDDYNAALERCDANIDVYHDAMLKAQETVDQYQIDLGNTTRALYENGEAQKTYAQEAASASEAVAQAEKEASDATVEALANAILGKREQLEQAIADHSITMDQLSEKNQETVKTLQDTWSSYYDYATNMFSALSGDITVSVDEMIANLQKNQDVINQWGDNMMNLRDRIDQMDVPAPVREGLGEMLTYLQEAGPEQAGAVAAIASATDEQLLALGQGWESGIDTAWNGMQRSMSEGAANMLADVEPIIQNVGESISATLEQTDWTEIGDDCMKGLAKGFEADDEVIAAAQKSAQDTIDKSKDTFQTHSPSKVYTDIGKFNNQGLANGMKSSVSQPVTAAQNVAMKVLEATKAKMQQMRNVGVQAVSMLANGIRAAQGTAYSAAFAVGSYTGQGFVNGLNSQRGSVMATAQSIASAASETISSALQVGSPSRVLTKIGMWTGIGFGNGMEDEIPYIQRTANKIASIASNIAVPDFSGPQRNWNASLAVAGGNVSYSVDSMRNELQNLKDAICAQPMLVNVTFEIDGREAGKAVATYVKKENNYSDLINNALMGVR